VFDPPAASAQATRDTIATVTFDPPAQKAGTSGPAADGESGGMNEKQNAGSYVPAGSFARVVILNGLDAPTGGQSQSNPHPVLLRIIDPATMPNGFRVDLKNCMVSAEGTGDIAAERAMVRLSRLSCIDPKGGAIDIQVRGYVAGEDGKAGLRGRVQTKTGQLLANALLASVGSGIGEAFKAAAETTTTTPLGGVMTSTTPGEGFQRGFGAGTQRAFDMLARYYVQLAEKIFPVIEVDGGRVADIVFTRGFVLEGR
jgi:conjugal transfer pilus assembly protein TraB